MLQAEVRIPQSLARHARTRGICTGGKPVADSTLDYQWVGPDENVWAQGDHIVECYAFAKDGSKLNRSIWNSNM